MRLRVPSGATTQEAPGAPSLGRTREGRRGSDLSLSAGRGVQVASWGPLPGMLVPLHWGQRSGKSSFPRFGTRLSATETRTPTVLSKEALAPGLTPRAPEADGRAP